MTRGSYACRDIIIRIGEIANHYINVMPRPSPARHWCFTLNNYVESDETLLGELIDSDDNPVTYVIYGRETGENGTPHLQGYLELSTKKRLSSLKSIIGTRYHFEKRRGTPEQAIEYCKKDGVFFTFGEPSSVSSSQGKRTDLEEIREKIKSGSSEKDIAEEHFSQWIWHRRSFGQYRNLCCGQRNFKSEVYVYYGATGSGKTRSIYECEPDLWISSDNSLKWFDGYHGQSAALFDDFVSIKNEKWGLLLRLLDRYPMSVPIKGGFVEWVPRKIYFTSNLHPDEWYTGVSEESRQALHRRITTIKYFDGNPELEEKND